MAEFSNNKKRGGKLISSKFATCVAISAGCILVSSQCLAALGQDPTIGQSTGQGTGQAAQQQSVIKRSVQSTLATYNSVSTVLPSGTELTEFTNASGKVFAISWQGPTLPDLNVMLGSYFSTFKSNRERASRLWNVGSPVTASDDEVVIRSNGRMGNFSGHAYVSKMIPTGVSIESLFP